ncbi:hypothetical protein BJ170DRAFT_702677 [Xylariales sp. AK1849]|nr:hypothetical protein BJ170DRAFT_702677 [Xylariales sp. AK1849]
MAFNLGSFYRQTWALTKKNFTIAVVRSWFSTSIRALILPILFVTLLLEIPNLSKSGNKYGIGTPTSVQSLADSMHGSKKLAIVQAPGLGSDVPEVLKRLTGPLDSNKVVYLDDDDKVWESCAVDYHGNSNCHAVITFNDSPLSGRQNATWNYTIQADPTRQSSSFDVNGHHGNTEGFWFPLQVAIDNAITNTSVVPQAFQFAYGNQEEYDREQKVFFLTLDLYILGFVFFVSMVTVAHHVSSMIASERETGMSQLVDAMGGGVAWSRVFSYVITFDLLYLPLWVILGTLFWYLLVPTSNAAIPIFWQILTGWAVTSTSVFGAAFFRKSSLAAIIVTGIAFILAAIGSYVANLEAPAGVGEIAALGLLFPSMNYVFFFDFMVRSEIQNLPTNIAGPLPFDHDHFNNLNGLWSHSTGAWFLWVLLVIQIIIYPLLAVLVEHILDDNSRHRRTKPTVKAVDGLSIVSQKGQILCLLGPNGSGKTTILDMIAGFQAPTGGSININALPSQIGICPQNNVFCDDLTVMEHLVFWNTVKSDADDAATLEKLIETCDLTHKKNSFAKNLSGGMKRKLQLACMLVGGSSICLMDEVTSGLDPISRRVIWNAVLGERSRRTMVFTTHFLDESEVLSDHIVIISLGKVKCHGTPAELKNKFGGGYRVHLPKTENVSAIEYAVTDHGDRYICRTPDSSSAARLLATLKDFKDSEHFITGPTIEDVFLKISKESHVLNDDSPEGEILDTKPSQPSATEPSQTPTQRAVFFRQVKALFIKRLIILRSQWWIHLFAIAIPLVTTYFLKDFLRDFQAPDCQNLIGAPQRPSSVGFHSYSDTLVRPLSVNTSLEWAANETQAGSGYISYYYPPTFVDNRDSFLFQVRNDGKQLGGGGIFLDNITAPLIAIPADCSSASFGLLNVANILRTGVPIHLSQGSLKPWNARYTSDTLIWPMIFCLLQAIYPAFFCLYPAYERRSKVRALQYSNGVRAIPLWSSYMLFDLMFVLLISLACTGVISTQLYFWALGYLWFVMFLYGTAAMLASYIVSTFAGSQPAAVAWAMLVMIVECILSIITFIISQDNFNGDATIVDGTTYGLGLIFPIQNLLRAIALSLNQHIVRCRGTSSIDDPGSIYAYGRPILLLIIQIATLFFLLLWRDGTVFSFSRTKAHQNDPEKTAVASGTPDVDAETRRVDASQADLLRMVHVSKSFGAKKAVDDVSLGMGEGEILALLGPNGAGKTTSIDMIRGQLLPSRGNIFLEGVDLQKSKRFARIHLGVCPQFDALDMLTVREHLTFYARCKGVPDIKTDVQCVMSKVDISPHAHKLAVKLSGGQKRKLSLAIALLGNPPVLLLDEPSSAMDAASKRVLWKTIEAVAPGRSVLLTTHSMEEADALATRAAIISKRLLAIGTTQELRRAHSNEYHVHLILQSAPLSSTQEMQDVADWVIETFSTCTVQFEGKNLGGQVRFIVPADTEVGNASKSFVRYLIEMLEEHKVALGIDCYSVGAATMERVFLSVVKESDTVEDEDEKTLWQRLGWSRG